MKIYYFILFSITICFTRVIDTLLIKNIKFQDLAYNNLTKNYEIFFVDKNGYPNVVSIDSNNTIVGKMTNISSTLSAGQPSIDVRNSIISTAWRWPTGFNDFILSSVLDDNRDFVFYSKKVNYDIRDNVRTGPDVAFINDSLYFVGWADNQEYALLMGKILNINENLDYLAIKDSNLADTSYKSAGALHVDIRDDFEHFPLTWNVILENDSSAIYGRIFDKNLVPQSSVFPVSSDTLGYSNDEIIIHGENRFLSCYRKYISNNGYDRNLFLSVVGFDGLTQQTLKVNNIPFRGGSASMSLNSDGFLLIVWDEKDSTFYNRGKIMGQRYDSNLIRIGDNFEIAPIEPENLSFNGRVILKGKRVVISYIQGWGTTDLVVKMFDFDNPVPIEETEITHPVQFALSQNYPTPFNPQTSIDFSVPQKEHVQINLYDISGKKVKTLLDETKNSGNYKLTFNLGNLASGLYLYRLQAGAVSLTKKLVLLK